jgi:membrane-bound metal-dependent hydrolase YbcI (DUF457 family)
MVSQFSRKVSVWNEMMSTESLPSGKKEKTIVYSKSVHNSLFPPEKKDIFSQYMIITLAAFISHIAYDVFVNAGESFPLLAPLIFSDFFIPQIYALPIEAAAILLVYLWYYTFKKISLI